MNEGMDRHFIIIVIVFVFVVFGIAKRSQDNEIFVRFGWFIL